MGVPVQGQMGGGPDVDERRLAAVIGEIDFARSLSRDGKKAS